MNGNLIFERSHTILIATAATLALGLIGFLWCIPTKQGKGHTLKLARGKKNDSPVNLEISIKPNIFSVTSIWFLIISKIFYKKEMNKSAFFCSLSVLELQEYKTLSQFLKICIYRETDCRSYYQDYISKSRWHLNLILASN